MSKERLVFPKPEDTRLRSRIRKWLQKVWASDPRPTSDQLPNRSRASAVAFAVGTVFGFCLLMNFVPGSWLTLVQTALLSVGIGLASAAWTFVYITNAKRLLKRGFITGAFVTLLAIFGYSFAFSVTGATDKPVEIAADAPLQGWSVAGAILIVVLLFLGMLHESKNS
ncbi:hypothetical protein [Rhizobium sp. Root482]|uniref:hypothetical protein n=1 Tax=Rhizobium sp. Root482 TaxID=1736543 RepID=UPI0006F49202|nr:hypothetical protein [Rhizobium sp. Root482]KQY26716.1 hypothetical protein ASD31_00445 [Rhizobium sp. Root482]